MNRSGRLTGVAVSRAWLTLLLASTTLDSP